MADFLAVHPVSENSPLNTELPDEEILPTQVEHEVLSQNSNRDSYILMGLHDQVPRQMARRHSKLELELSLSHLKVAYYTIHMLLLNL